MSMFRRISALVIVVVALLSAGGYVWYTKKAAAVFQVIFLDVGQGDGTLITFSTGEKLLVDCGPDRKVVAELGKVIPFYDRTIDYLLVTHFDLDHYGGCVDVLERYDVKHIITNGITKPEDAYWQVWNVAREHERATTQVIEQAHRQVIGGQVFEFLSPDKHMVESIRMGSNNASVVFRLFSPTGETFLFTGDIEAVVEDALVRRYCHDKELPGAGCKALRADILKVAHHGSDTSSREIFLSAVMPKVAVISSGRHNRFGHPSLRTIRHLERIGAAILRTDELGAILKP